MHPVYKVSLELYVWSAQTGAYDSVLQFTSGPNKGDGNRHPALWILQEGNRVKLHATASVSGNPHKTIFPYINKDCWNSLEYGVV